MSISRKVPEHVGIVNASGQPEIVIELDGLVLSMKPPVPEPELPAERPADLDDQS
ncbi:MAG: hypothetical protein WCC60_18660 [Ilumatobacteraceae bacterium]